MNRKRKMLFIIVFAFFVIWFYLVHPIMIFDTDDWRYAYQHRNAVPIWKDWNPARVFPEVFMPIASTIGVYIFYPVVGDFFSSLTLAYAIFTATAMIILIYVIYCKYKNNNATDDVLLMIYFILISHFWIFRTSPSGNNYMLKSADACTYFYYVIPNLLNAAVTLWYSMDEELHGSIILKNHKKGSAFIFLVYFCIFSNIWAGIIIGAYIGAILTYDLVVDVFGKRFELLKYCRNHIMDFVILLLWIISQIFEMNGGRAKSIETESIQDSIRETLKIVKQDCLFINRKFLLMIAVIAVSGIVLIVWNKKYQDIKNIIIWILAALIMSLYLIITCARADSWYIGRADVFYGVFFFGMMIILICGLQILKNIPSIKIVIPLLLFIVTIDCNTSLKTFQESNVRQIEPDVAKMINEDIMSQFIMATEEGKMEMVLYVPLFEANSSNWPISIYAGNNISEMLYKYGVIKEKVIVTEVIPTYDKNIALHITNVK